MLEQIVAKTDGVPLFVEELTKTVLESGLLREEDGAYVLAAALTPLAIPSTLHDSPMARLDRLAPMKEIAQIGAAIGREFSYRLLEAVSPIGAGAAGRPGPADGGGTDPRAWRAAGCELHLQACAGAGYRLRLAAAQPASAHPRRHCAGAEGAFRRRDPAGDIAHHYTEAGLAEPAAPSLAGGGRTGASQSAPRSGDATPTPAWR